MTTDLKREAMAKFPLGTRVRLKQAIPVAQLFAVPGFATGTVSYYEPGESNLCVRLDDYHAELDEWENELSWYGTDELLELADDLEIVAPATAASITLTKASVMLRAVEVSGDPQQRTGKYREMARDLEALVAKGVTS